jgi:hypothetical protein
MAIAVPLFGNGGAVVGSLALTEEHCIWKSSVRDRLADILLKQSAHFPTLLAAQHGAVQRASPKPFH